MYAEDELTLQDDDGRNDYRVPALFRGLLILQMFNAQTRTLSMNELAEGLGVTVSAIYRIVHTLTEMGYLRKLAKNTYELGPQVVSDGFSYLASRDLVDIAAPHLNALRDRTSLSCHLSIREQTDSLYIYRAFAAQRLSVNIPIGTRIPCHCTAMGRMLLTGLSPAALDALYQSVRLDDHPPPAPKTLPALRQMISDDRERGWVIHRSDYSTAIARGIYNHLGEVVAAINLSGPEAVMDGEVSREHFQQELAQTAEAISRELGGHRAG
ncbi:IclR family transcriptional regulator [Pokkaliibacter plantistimulans]|uniref:IclR family transcriptional regulator n=2 Tax=Pseudomonadota TaxID=1224 RepID=A0ABX5LV98_9GAMM|nr:IclR family transcriptional regulator [Pokkaliibacter plantistimulans]PPC74331.1 IclR family transcriptional regulator [Pokkaliibacter plantistimulans]PXF28635.1 IclR family transcriptional regulator [Pokkaliibacter plantistimulans]